MEPGDLVRIMEGTGAGAVLSLQHDECLARFNIDYPRMSLAGGDLGLTMSRCPIRDFDPQDTKKCLPQAVRALAALLQKEHRTYVHCTAGISRAPLTVFAYLTLVAEVREERARELIMTGRPESIPYWEAYDEARAGMVAGLWEMIDRRASELLRLGIASDGRRARRQAETEVIREALSET